MVKIVKKESKKIGEDKEKEKTREPKRRKR